MRAQSLSLLLALSACYVDIPECAFRCDEAKSCPAGYSCGEDRFCYSGLKTRDCENVVGNDPDMAPFVPYAFVSSKVFRGYFKDVVNDPANPVYPECQNLANGIKTADCICSVLGRSLGGSTEWHAFLSHNDNPAYLAKEHIGYPGPWRLPGDEDTEPLRFINEGQTLSKPLNFTDQSMQVPPSDSCLVWSGTRNFGMLEPAGAHCNQWGNAGSGMGAAGRCKEMDKNWIFNDSDTPNCDTEHRIYCFQEKL